ncbi:unnamed protein product, partial [Heterotrigona itama]
YRIGICIERESILFDTSSMAIIEIDSSGYFDRIEIHTLKRIIQEHNSRIRETAITLQVSTITLFSIDIKAKKEQ